MSQSNESAAGLPVPSRDVLTEILRDGAQRLLVQAIDAEVDDWIGRHAGLKNERGRQLVVKNGHHPTRTLVTGVGPVEVSQPRVLDRRIVGRRKVQVAPGERVTEDLDAEGRPVERFRSAILPPYLRKTQAIEELIPWLYLKGVSTGAFAEALQALVGPQAAGLSATTITRLMTVWQDEYKAWNRRSLEGKSYVYVWADGIHFNIRLEEDRQCILVLMGATADGRKELIAVADGHRESEQSGFALLLDCKQRGLTIDPKLATADGALRLSGRRCGRCIRRRGSNAAGCTRPPTCWTRGPRRCKAARKPSCTRSGCRRRAKTLTRRSITSWRRTRRSIRMRWNA